MPPFINFSADDDSSLSQHGTHLDNPLIHHNIKMSRHNSNHSVCFDDEDIVVHRVASLLKYKSEIWYSKKEYRAMKARDAKLLKMIRSGRFDEESSSNSALGLKEKSTGSSRRRLSVLYAVLFEQNCQQSLGENDPELIAEASRCGQNNAPSSDRDSDDDSDCSSEEINSYSRDVDLEMGRMVTYENKWDGEDLDDFFDCCSDLQPLVQQYTSLLIGHFDRYTNEVGRALTLGCDRACGELVKPTDDIVSRWMAAYSKAINNMERIAKELDQSIVPEIIMLWLLIICLAALASDRLEEIAVAFRH